MPLVTRQVNLGNVFSEDTEPPNVVAGSIWVDTSEDAPAISTSNGTNFDNIKLKLNGNTIPLGVLL